MILRPVRPGVAHRAADHEPAGRVDQQPVVRAVDAQRRPAPGSTTCSRMSGASMLSRSMSAACWLETTTVSSRTALSPSYSMVTWVLPSGPQVGHRAGLADLGRAGGPAGAPARSAAASARGCRCRRSRTSGPGRRRPARSISSSDSLDAGSRRRCRRPARCRATARRSRRSPRRRRRRSPWPTSRSRSPGSVSRTSVGMSTYAAGGDLARDVHLAGGDHRLDRDPAARVLRQQRVEDGVADRVAHLVRVALGHRLAGEQPSTRFVTAVLRPRPRRSVGSLTGRALIELSRRRQPWFIVRVNGHRAALTSPQRHARVRHHFR